MSMKLPFLQLKGHPNSHNPVCTFIDRMLVATPCESPQTTEQRIVIYTIDVFGQCNGNNVEAPVWYPSTLHLIDATWNQCAVIVRVRTPLGITHNGNPLQRYALRYRRKVLLP
ncbi:hypothetical protein BU15DRAFT_67998 [Melanogaster broomeanus]|nr:hypothetical protein BU15DRAFT_67998 [Melanogaster broomeanus]